MTRPWQARGVAAIDPTCAVRRPAPPVGRPGGRRRLGPSGATAATVATVASGAPRRPFVRRVRGAIRTALVGLGLGVGSTLVGWTSVPALAQGAGEPVLIGDVTTIDRIGAPAVSYQQGRDLAVGFVASAGGVMGSRPLRVVSVDPGGDPEAAARAVAELKKQGVALFIGGLLSDVTLAAARAAGETPFLAADARLPAAVVAGVPNLFQIGPSAEALGRTLADAAARGEAMRWGVVAQDDFYGRGLAHAFWDALRGQRAGVALAMERYVPTLSGAVDAALADLRTAAPDGLLLGLRHGDLVAFVQAAAASGLLDGVTVVAPQLGTPDLLAALGSGVTTGWVTTGYACCDVGGQPNRAFAQSYRAADPRKADPTLGALYGYTALTTVATIIDNAWSLEPAALEKALHDLDLMTPVGALRFARTEHQSGLPLWVGEIRDGGFVWSHAVDPAALSRP